MTICFILITNNLFDCLNNARRIYTDIYPGAPLTNFNDRGGGGVIFYAKKKKSQLFLAYPKKPLVLFHNPKKIHLFFLCNPNNPGVFHRPKRSLWAKISDPKKSRVLLPPPLSLEYVSGAPGDIYLLGLKELTLNTDLPSDLTVTNKPQQLLLIKLNIYLMHVICYRGPCLHSNHISFNRIIHCILKN